MDTGFACSDESWLGLVLSEFTTYCPIPFPHYTTKTSEIAFNEDIRLKIYGILSELTFK